MRQLRIYLDTSVINFLFAEDAPEKRDATWAFFDRAKRQGIPLFISQVVIDEISRTQDARKRGELLNEVAARGLRMLPDEMEEEIELLVQAYMTRGLFRMEQIDDATHVALCTVNMVDVLASWNFRHLANVNRERRVMAINESCGYVYPLRIVSPEEVVDDE
jgi:predicted nucleic acid-binding protein